MTSRDGALRHCGQGLSMSAAGERYGYDSGDFLSPAGRPEVALARLSSDNA